jgi:hypothetical protein
MTEAKDIVKTKLNELITFIKTETQSSSDEMSPIQPNSPIVLNSSLASPTVPVSGKS